MKGIFTSVRGTPLIGVVGSLFAFLFGGWDTALITLIIFMGFDYFTGLVVAGVFKVSKNSENGALESKAGWKGLFRKGMTLLIVLIAYRLDLFIVSAFAPDSGFVKDAVIIAFIVNETISIIENAGLMGVPIPRAITQAIDILKKTGEN